MALTLRKEKERFFVFRLDPETNEPIKFGVRRIPPGVDRQLTVKHKLNRVKRAGDNVSEVSVSNAAAYTRDMAVYAWTSTEGLQLRVAADQVEGLSDALGRPVTAGDLVDLDKELTDAVKAFFLTEEPDVADWILEKEKELRLRAAEVEEGEERS